MTLTSPNGPTDVAFESAAKTSKTGDYLALNSQLNFWAVDSTGNPILGEDGTKQIPLEKDKEAVKAYFLNHVNPNTQWFTNLEEKLKYLIEEDYYESEFFDKYDPEFVKKVFKNVYAKNFRFPTFLGAYKYYTSYTLKTFDGQRYLERFEDRIAITALYLADGNKKLALNIAEEIISGRLQPATPTFLNAGKAQRGELVSCFEAGTLVDTINGQTPIEDIQEGDFVLTHDGSYQRVSERMARNEDYGVIRLKITGSPVGISATSEHPVLIKQGRNNKSLTKAPFIGDGDTDTLKWTAVEDVKVGDFIVASYPTSPSLISEIKLSDYVDPKRWNLKIIDGKLTPKTVDVKNNKKKDNDSNQQVKAVTNVIPLNEDFGRLIGYYLSEGYVHINRSSSESSVKGLRFTFGSKESVYIADVISLAETLFGITAKVNVNNDGSTNVNIWSKTVGEFFLATVKSGFDKKYLPNEFILADKEFLTGVLVGMFRGDGCTLPNGIIASLTNLPLVYQLRNVALRAGLLPYLRTYISASGKAASEIRISAINTANYDFVIKVGKNLHSFNAVNNEKENKAFAFWENEYPLYRVSGISLEEKEVQVYNLEVENNHTYSVNGFTVHNCFLLNVDDDLNSILRSVNSAGQLSKRGGGVALALTNLRAKGDPIKKILNQASGVVPVMKILEDTFSYANQLGARQGAGAVYLNAHHPDIMDFLDTKRENADEKVRIKTLSLGVVIPDITFELARNNEPMYLFSPYDVEKFYGVQFAYINVTEKYREMVDNPEIHKTKINPREFLSTLAEIQMESGYPYIMFEDAVNRANAIDGKIIMSNLCLTGDTEILTGEGYQKVADLYTSQADFDVIVDKRARDMDWSATGVSQEKSTRMFRTAENAEVFKLTTSEGFEIRATEWHKFYIERNEEVVKLQLNELKIGDKLLVQPSKGSFGTIHEPEKAFISGAVAADGTYGNNVSSSGNKNITLKMNLHGSKSIFASRFEESAKSILSGRTDLMERQAVLAPIFTTHSTGGYQQLSSAPLAKLLAEEGFTQETKTTIPEFVLRGDHETQVAYIDGLFSLDGTVTAVKDNTSIQLGSINREHLVELQRLLLNLGVYSRIYAGRKNAGKALLPDGKGGLKEYNQAPIWSLRVSDHAGVDTLYPMITWKPEVRTRYENALSQRGNKQPYRTHRYRATVETITFDGVEDVYDVTVENGNSVIFNGISTGNCSEILQVQEPSVINDDQTYDMLGKDISCNLASLNIRKALESKDFGLTVETAIRLLTQVSDMSDITAVPTVAEGNRRSHAIGLGAMNLAGAFGHYEMYYGDKESLDLTNMYFRTVTYHAIRTSMTIAKERKETFVGFEKSAYASGEYFEKYYDERYAAPITAKVAKIFADNSIDIPTIEDWAKLAADVKKHGMYNQNLQAIPPTGSISYINNSTSSIHPITALIEKRKESKQGTISFQAPEMTNLNKKYFQDAYEIGPKKEMDVYSVAQFYVDQGLSLTLFFKENVTTRDVNQSQVYAFSKGKVSNKELDERGKELALFPQAELKTIYYIRLQAQVLAGISMEECVSCAL